MVIGGLGAPTENAARAVALERKTVIDLVTTRAHFMEESIVVETRITLPLVILISVTVSSTFDQS